MSQDNNAADNNAPDNNAPDLTNDEENATIHLDIDEAYNEFLFGNSTEIKVSDNKNNTEIIIPKDTIKQLYSGLNLKKSVIKKVIEAHVTVLKHGLDTGNERVIAIDTKTGKIEADKTGSPFRVKWSLRPGYNGNIVTVHNHPSSNPFSPVDIYYFGISPCTLCMGVQGHNGRTYSIRKTANTEFEHTEDSLGTLFDIIFSSKAYDKKSHLEKGEIFVRLLAEHMKWEFLKGDESNV